MGKGWVLLVEALTEVWQGRWAALRIAALPTLVIGVLDLIIQYDYWHGDPESLGILWATAAMFFVIPVIAIGWHRYVLLNEVPHAFAPQLKVGRTLLYGANYLMIALLLTLIAILVFFVVYGLTISISGPDYPGFSEVFERDRYPVGYFVALFCATVVFLNSYFRYGATLLPSIAVDDRGQIRRRSWRETRALSGTVFWLALWAAVLQFPLVAGEDALRSLGILGDPSYLSDMVGVPIYAVLYGAVAICGAAVLNRLYRAVQASERRPDSQHTHHDQA